MLLFIVANALGCTLASSQAWKKEIFKKSVNRLKNFNWREADQFAITSMTKVQLRNNATSLMARAGLEPVTWISSPVPLHSAVLPLPAVYVLTTVTHIQPVNFYF